MIHEWTGRDDKGGVELLDDWSSRGCKRALSNRDNLHWMDQVRKEKAKEQENRKAQKERTPKEKKNRKESQRSLT